MDLETNFYQISGYKAHSNSWPRFKTFDDGILITEMWESKTLRPQGMDSPLELVLGILPSGASYLLMPQEQAFKFMRHHNLNDRGDRSREPWKATQFHSLSPIAFDTIHDLRVKVATYKQRPRNRNRREQEVPKDNSQANRGYVQAETTVKHFRADFEHQRTLYRLLVRDLQPGRVALYQPTWLDRGVRVIALVFGEWSVDIRPKPQRLEEPRLVDAGWTDALCPSFFEQGTATTTVHVQLRTGGKMVNRNTKRPCFSEVVEDDMEGLERRLRELMRHESGMPLVVLVHDEDMARGILSRAGVDIGTWGSGLSNLLPIAVSGAATPNPSFVDVQSLVKAVMQTDAGRTVPRSAKVLHMQTNTNTCAGDDSLLLLHMWASMAQGLAIDEQHEMRKAHEPTCTQVLAPPPESQPTTHADVDPNDMDPNDQEADLNDVPLGLLPTREDDFSSDDD